MEDGELAATGVTTARVKVIVGSHHEEVEGEQSVGYGEGQDRIADPTDTL